MQMRQPILSIQN